MNIATKEIQDKIAANAIGVMPTDTVYGIVGNALNREVVERIYTVKQRQPTKPYIILIGDILQLAKCSVQINASQAATLQHLWPGPNSIILPCPDVNLSFLHRGTKTLAIRLPKPYWLRNMLMHTGPLIATSANKSGQATPTTIDDIRLGLPGLDFYLQGEVGLKPSRLGRMEPDATITWIRN